MRSLRVFPIVFMGIAGLLGGCPPAGVSGYDPNSVFRGLTLEKSPVGVGDEVGAIVKTVPLAEFSSHARGRIVVNFGDDGPAREQQAVLPAQPSGAGKYRVQATGDGTVAARLAYRYGRAGTFTVTAMVYKDIYGYGEKVDGGATASITVVAPPGNPGPAPTSAPNPPAPIPTAAPQPGGTPVPATPQPATPAPQTPVPVTPQPVTPAPQTPPPTGGSVTPQPVTPTPATPVPATPTPATPIPVTPAPVTPAPATPVPPTPVPPTPTPQPTFFDPPDPTPRPSETPGDFQDDPDPTPRP